MSKPTMFDFLLKPKPIYDPAQEQPETINKTIDYIVFGGDSPLPLWPKLKGKK